jgi:hypothetical protein
MNPNKETGEVMSNLLREEVLGPCTGIRFEIRRIRHYDYLREMRDVPFSVAPGTKEELDKLQQALEAMPAEKREEIDARAERVFLTYGIVRMKYPGEENWRKPNIWFDDELTCPEDHVTVRDLGSDGDLVVKAIARLTYNLKGVEALEGIFRQQQRADSGPGGEAVRPEAEQSTTE